MANQTEIGELSINLKMRLEGLEKGIEMAKKKLQEIEKKNESLKNSNSGLDASFIAMSATAVAAFIKIKGVINDCVEEYKSYTQAMSSLSDVADYTGQDLDNLGGIMNKFGSYMTQSDLATTIKNFSLMGFTAEQTEQMIEALTNSAIRNRNANYTVSEAVRVASEGYRQGLSTLSDSAGVTENLSVMLDNYAKSIGKTASQLTEAEINQAYLNRTMYAAQPFAGAMEDYLDSLAGKQGEYSQAMRETKVAYAEALEPTLIKITETKTKLIKLLGDLINSNNTATTGITAFIATLLTLTISFTAGRKAIQKFKQTLKETNAEAKSLKVTLGGLIATSAIVAGINVVSNVLQEQKNIMQELKQAKEEYDKVMNGTVSFDDNSVSSMQSMVDSLQSYINVVNDYNDNNVAINYGQEFIDEGIGNVEAMKKAVKDLKDENMVLAAQMTSASDGFKKVFNITDKGNITIEKATEIMGVYNKRIEEANAVKEIKNAMDTETVKTQQQEAAKLKINAQQMQEYLNIIKSSNKSSKEYQDAEKKLAEAYSECATASGINIDLAQDYINAEQGKADQAWNSSQEIIRSNIDVINSYIEMANAAVNDEAKQAELANTIGVSYEKIIPTLTSVLNILQLIGGYTPTEVPNITPTATVTRNSGSSSYSNKALDNYKKEIAHKKAMDQISLQQEIQMYETALKKYAKTTDEKRELREKIYELNKELAQKEKDILDQQTEDYENYIQEQKNLRGAAYDVTQQTQDYNKIIQMHKNYLNQIMKDERLSLDERKELYREELQVIRDYEQQKRDLRVEQIDNTVSQLTNAITKQLEEMQEKDKELIDKNIEAVEKWKEARINAINEEYDARIEAINKELEALDKAEQQKSRDEEDAEYERKKKRLEDLVAYEHDVTTKANYQKELDKLIAEYQKTLDQRALEDKKEALNAQKELLQEEQDNKVQAIEDEADKQKELYDKQLDELEKYYDEQIDMAQKTAENMLINMEQNQDKILNLLQNYGDAYEITGQSLGEKLAQGINEGIASKIENIISKIQNTIDAGIEAQIAKMASSVYQYEAGANKPQTTSVNIYQTNNIEQNPEMPSETYRKLNNVSQKLAEEFAGM